MTPFFNLSCLVEKPFVGPSLQSRSPESGTSRIVFRRSWGVNGNSLGTMADGQPIVGSVRRAFQTHVFNGLVVYELPFGKGRAIAPTNRAVSAL